MTNVETIVNKHGRVVWSSNQMWELKKLWDYDHMTQVEIAEKLGVSPSTVSGQIMRNRKKYGYSHKPKGPKGPTRRAVYAKVPKPPKPPKPVKVEIKPAASETRLIWDLQPHHCRWPASGQGDTMLYCCADIVHGSYCAEHYGRAHQ